MKREKITYPFVKAIKPFFWKECRFCNKEFKKENGFKIIDYNSIIPHLYSSYCCNNCAKNIDEVKELINKED